MHTFYFDKDDTDFVGSKWHMKNDFILFHHTNLDQNSYIQDYKECDSIYDIKEMKEFLTKLKDFDCIASILAYCPFITFESDK